MRIEELKKYSKELLESGEVGVVIGYALGSMNSVHAFFAMSPDDLDRFIYDERCKQNLAVYLQKQDICEMGKPAIIASGHTLRSILQLMNEHQINDNGIVVITEDAEGNLVHFHDAASIAQRISEIPFEYFPDDREILKKLESMSNAERWKFWTDEFSRCIKCYACRATCPLCYCSRCTVECNQPQWIHVPSHELGNLEWHTMRAMHLSGRCVNCGACYRSCPLSIPLHLLTIKTADVIEQNFGLRAGSGVEETLVLSTFKPDDKENFIR